MDTLRFLDILGFALGVLYLLLEYRASIWLWLVGIVMPAVDMVLYFKAGLYADFGMAVYYCIAAVYGYAAWKWPALLRRRNAIAPSDYPGDAALPQAAHPQTNAPSDSQTGAASPRANSQAARPERPITRFPLKRILPASVAFLLLWLGIRFILVSWTDSTVPVADAFTTALSIIALWALAQKYAEQWLLWLAVDAVCCALYVYKGIPFKAAIYGIYTVFAVFGYFKWLKLTDQ